jgi:hypothetical protein
MHYSPHADVPIEVDVRNPDGALVSGSYCMVELRIPRKFPSFIVSADAIIFNVIGSPPVDLHDGQSVQFRPALARATP